MDFTQAKELMELQKKAEAMKKDLSNTHIEAEYDGVVVTVDGEMHIVSTVIEDESLLKNRKRLEKGITEAANKGIKKAQQIAMEKMQEVMPGLGGALPGM